MTKKVIGLILIVVLISSILVSTTNAWPWSKHYEVRVIPKNAGSLASGALVKLYRWTGKRWVRYRPQRRCAWRPPNYAIFGYVPANIWIYAQIKFNNNKVVNSKRVKVRGSFGWVNVYVKYPR
ncbi:MAG: hypothetical protein C4562_02680 [Actinobacteria bacterium]|nr:MAG: hypothetical protein C4562_02680 [Actinomycetota bacterium]